MDRAAQAHTSTRANSDAAWEVVRKCVHEEEATAPMRLRDTPVNLIPMRDGLGPDWGLRPHRLVHMPHRLVHVEPGLRFSSGHGATDYPAAAVALEPLFRRRLLRRSPGREWKTRCLWPARTSRLDLLVRHGSVLPRPCRGRR